MTTSLGNDIFILFNWLNERQLFLGLRDTVLTLPVSSQVSNIHVNKILQLEYGLQVAFVTPILHREPPNHAHSMVKGANEIVGLLTVNEDWRITVSDERNSI